MLISAHSLELKARRRRASGRFDRPCCHISAHCSPLISPSHSDPTYTLLNQPDYYDKDLPCFLFISFSFQRSVSPDPALNYDYYHSGRQADSFPRGRTATDPETLELIWESADQSGEWRAGGREREKENSSAENKHADAVHGEDRTWIRLLFFHLQLQFAKQLNLEPAVHCGELFGLFAWRRLISDYLHFRWHASPLLNHLSG